MRNAVLIKCIYQNELGRNHWQLTRHSTKSLSPVQHTASHHYQGRRSPPAQTTPHTTKGEGGEGTQPPTTRHHQNPRQTGHHHLPPATGNNTPHTPDCPSQDECYGLATIPPTLGFKIALSWPHSWVFSTHSLLPLPIGSQLALRKRLILPILVCFWTLLFLRASRP